MKLHIEDSIVIEMDGKKVALGQGEYEFDSASQFIKFVEGLGEPTKQPLIKDEKIRKAVLAFAEVIGVDRLVYGVNGEFYMGASSLQMHQIDIPSDTYTIAELCGEEG